MTRRVLHLERLLGRKVYDRDGLCAGRIEEIRAQRAGDHLLVHECILGSAGLSERLSITGVSVFLLRLLGGRSASRTHQVGWDDLDLSDLNRLRIKIRRDQLKSL
jgi:hypothetical protein